MQQLSDDGILSLTSENDLDIVNMDEQPNAVFIIVPDERFTRHRFVTLFITQMYKELVEKANLNLRRKQKDTAILKRNTYFILDEFGNLPKFENIEGRVNDYIDNNIAQMEEVIKNLPDKHEQSWEELNKIFIALL